MFKKITQKIIARFGILPAIEFVLGTGLCIIILISVLQMNIPTGKIHFESQAFNAIKHDPAGNFIYDFQNNSNNLQKKNGKIKSGLFKAASGLIDKPMADKTIERIRSQLKLQCIMQMSGQATAYINIKDKGLTKCVAGEKIYDLFTVISINEKTVEISIIDHRVTLSI